MSEAKASFPLLRKLGFPEKKHIRIKDPAGTEEILQRFVDGGFKKLQVVADFDFTMTRVYTEDGERCHSSWGVLERSPLMPEFYRRDSLALLEKYYPIACSSTMTDEEKIPPMVEWFSQVMQLLLRCSLDRDIINRSVAASNAQLRSGTEDMLGVLQLAQVPLLVLSAGLGDTVKLLLEKFHVLSNNVKVVANFFKYDEEGRVIGFEDEIVYVFSKNVNANHHSKYFTSIGDRSNAMILGDAFDDVKMAAGIPTPNSLLKIGFLNDKIEQNLSAYEAAYDIVLLEDQTMDVAAQMLSLMFTAESKL